MDSILITHKNLSDKFSDELYDPIRDVINKIQPNDDSLKNTWVPKTLEILEPTDRVIIPERKFKKILVKEKVYKPIAQKLANKLKNNEIQKIVYQQGEFINTNNYQKRKYQVFSINRQSSNAFAQKIKKMKKNEQKQQKFNLFSSFDLPFNFLLGKNNGSFTLKDMKNEIIAKQINH